MIIVYHHSNKIIKVTQKDGTELFFNGKKNIAWNILNLAKKHPNDNLVWCKKAFESQLNLIEIELLLPNKRAMLSYGNNTFLSDKIGYIDESPFIKINKEVRFPTWIMSADTGIISCEALNLLQSEIVADFSFEYFLNSIAKVAMLQGLFCYSEPKLLISGFQPFENNNQSTFDLFRFAKQHYKSRWLLLLFINLVIHELKFPLLPLFFSIFYKKRNKIEIDFNDDLFIEQQIIISEYDVLIPTIGRKNYLYDFLEDLNLQTVLPKNVIIVEQNPQIDSVSELDYLTLKKWNFIIKHTFTHQAGACNARNIGMAQCESYWTFMADDDISIDSDFSEKVFYYLSKTKATAATINCHLKHEKSVFNNIMQWRTFGTCSSFVETSAIKKCTFVKGFEFGFGEDVDFGMQLRNLGHDVLYFPYPKILHHKAPIGGFRTKPILAWHSQEVQPKPSPTIMLCQILHNSKQQILGYKTISFFKFYKNQKTKNPIKYFNNFQKQWKQSVFWANKLKTEKW